MRLLVNHMQGQIYMNIIRYKHEFRFKLGTHVINFKLGTHVIVCQ